MLVNGASHVFLGFLLVKCYGWLGYWLDVNALRPRQNGRHFADHVFRCIFLNENIWISLKISQKFGPKIPINNNPAMLQIMAWHRSGDKTLSEPMLVSLLTQICVTRPQWVKQVTGHSVHKALGIKFSRSLWGLWCQKQVSRACISNCILQ